MTNNNLPAAAVSRPPCEDGEFAGIEGLVATFGVEASRMIITVICERCARIAEEMSPEGGYAGNDWYRASREIAGRIRKG